ncbi:HPr(Ser) kinase/phosphatase [Wenzhouxiangella marina]|uniref:HPr kinase/phosphorylase n=1 Tax=Wenzhouxiangella marina TaxID=1579979 RepID=A0A0K0XYM4_9GAMM|nr:HPr(Ser) kinase/phosphatase [Wenzhouxiangella marina]AKS42794.1 HPr kinase/phosphorylase [Wenzhouxiangella marina]MBB6087528.1 HPr kinase/phosphorylase [Wenzhouxiangella marina]
MTASITPAEIFQAYADRLELRWVTGRRAAEQRQIAASSIRARPSLIGFLSLIHPNRVQVIGEEEGAWLDGLEAKIRWEAIARIVDAQPALIIVASGLEVAEDLEEWAKESGTPLLTSARPAWELVNFLQYRIARRLARSVTLHGVFMEIFTLGVLLTGESGTGKSELALELLSRGHRLIADDAPEFTQLTPDTIEGACPPVLRDCLEVRGLGILNIRRMFGDAAVKSTKFLRLIIHLHLPGEEPPGGDRLHGNIGARRVLDLDIPQINLPVMAGRNLAVMAEAAVRDHMLRMKGFDAAAEFVERHGRLMGDRE